MNRHPKAAARAGAGAAAVPLAKNTVQGRIIAIAASTGGPHAIHNILSQLPADLPVPIVITQHIADGFTQGMVDWLDAVTPLRVRVAAHGDVLTAGNVYINPAEHAMRITEQRQILIGDRDLSKTYHPSCDTMLNSVAQAYREHAIGLIMSGMGDDGVLGMQAIRATQGVTLAQDAKSSVVFGMNSVAISRGYIDQVLALASIPDELRRLVGSSK
ncbi:chemotaxis response regulator protein-glutamate methylesterase of group 3 operon [mine drainage metagenome]|uniref:protein-glutamate methylesterase n=1 Tax=mine drainage metagenome TaxID=410659 RepID=A0A1J5Q3T0_9ZZZZ